MSCPTCTHTMQGLGLGWFWCDRCGTLKKEHHAPNSDIVDIQAPMLVQRCREFEERLPLVTAGDGRCWHTLGIAESINVPERRPT